MSIVLVVNANDHWSVHIVGDPTEWRLVEQTEMLICATTTRENDNFDIRVIVKPADGLHYRIKGIHRLDGSVVDGDIDSRITAVNTRHGVFASITVGARCNADMTRSLRDFLFRFRVEQAVLFGDVSIFLVGLLIDSFTDSHYVFDDDRKLPPC